MIDAKRAYLLMALLLGGVLGLFVIRVHWLPCLATWLDVGQPPQRADYVLILGGDANVRPLVAAAIVRAGLVPKVLISCSHFEPEHDDGILLPEYKAVREALLRRDIPAANILTLGANSRTTYDEAIALRAYLGTGSSARVLVVTSDYHTRRARWIFRRVLGARGPELTFVSAPNDAFLSRHWWLCEEGAIAIVGENLKLFYYLFRYSLVPYTVLGCLFVGAGLGVWWVRALRTRQCAATASR